MAILHLFIRTCGPCILPIFRPTIFKFWILIEDYIKVSDTFSFFGTLSKSSENYLGLGPYKIKIFLIIFHHFLRIFPIAINFRVDPMYYFDISNHKEKFKKIGAKK
jgi:hypothetical protein